MRSALILAAVAALAVPAAALPGSKNVVHYKYEITKDVSMPFTIKLVGPVYRKLMPVPRPVPHIHYFRWIDTEMFIVELGPGGSLGSIPLSVGTLARFGYGAGTVSDQSCGLWRKFQGLNCQEVLDTVQRIQGALIAEAQAASAARQAAIPAVDPVAPPLF